MTQKQNVIILLIRQTNNQKQCLQKFNVRILLGLVRLIKCGQSQCPDSPNHRVPPHLRHELSEIRHSVTAFFESHFGSCIRASQHGAMAPEHDQSSCHYQAMTSPKLRLNARAVTRDLCHHRAAPGGCVARPALRILRSKAAQWQWPGPSGTFS